MVDAGMEKGFNYRWTVGIYSRPAFAMELVRLSVALLCVLEAFVLYRLIGFHSYLKKPINSGSCPGLQCSYIDCAVEALPNMSIRNLS